MVRLIAGACLIPLVVMATEAKAKCGYVALGDWKCIKELAETQTRKGNDNISIQIARALLFARHQGYLEGQKHPSEPDPIGVGPQVDGSQQ